MLNLKNIAVISSLLFATSANADVYVHGKGTNTYQRGLTQDYRYWGNYATTNVSGTKYAWNWDGDSEVVTNNTVVGAYNASLPSNSVVRCHSAGCLITARAIYLYGNSKFSRVVAAASAEGGSELASIGSLGGAIDGLNNSLRPNVARSFSHNSSIMTYHGGGSNSEAVPTWGLFLSPVTSATLPGEDDGAVAYHSTLGKASTGTWCDTDSVWWNPATYGCTAWNKGTQYTGHAVKEVQYWGHSPSTAYAARGW